ncbi:MAG: methylated-DNA-[protein]-cysteine S-methyltransferase [Pseudohongiellaceae bacterium]|jgi:methylated-DNA-[protein]-cysteine S-methyltransferase
MSAATYALIDSPLGPLCLRGTDAGLTAIEFAATLDLDGQVPAATRSPLLLAAMAQLTEYFAGRRRQFELPLAPQGTEFQLAVWEQLRAVPFGETTSYGAMAKALGRPQASRAVGAANGANPLPIVVPCHRVVGADGALTGFGGGLGIKRQLLIHEGQQLCGDRVLPQSHGQGMLPL